MLQAKAGLTHVFGIESSKMVQSLIILGVVLAAAISAMTGVEKGVRRLSEFNMLSSILLLIAILVMGNTVYLLNTFTQSIGQYFQTIVFKTFDVYAYDGSAGADWKSGWTIFSGHGGWLGRRLSAYLLRVSAVAVPCVSLSLV